MNSESQATHGHRRLTERIGNPLEWSYVDKILAILGAIIVVSGPSTVWFTVTHYVRAPMLLVTGL